MYRISSRGALHRSSSSRISSSTAGQYGVGSEVQGAKQLLVSMVRGGACTGVAAGSAYTGVIAGVVYTGVVAEAALQGSAILRPLNRNLSTLLLDLGSH
jgi:hypothetical protein